MTNHRLDSSESKPPRWLFAVAIGLGLVLGVAVIAITPMRFQASVTLVAAAPEGSDRLQAEHDRLRRVALRQTVLERLASMEPASAQRPRWLEPGVDGNWYPAMGGSVRFVPGGRRSSFVLARAGTPAEAESLARAYADVIVDADRSAASDERSKERETLLAELEAWQQPSREWREQREQEIDQVLERIEERLLASVSDGERRRLEIAHRAAVLRRAELEYGIALEGPTFEGPAPPTVIELRQRLDELDAAPLLFWQIADEEPTASSRVPRAVLLPTLIAALTPLTLLLVGRLLVRLVENE